MAIDVRAEVKENHLHVHLRGAYGLKATLDAFGRALDLARSEGLSAVLIDFRDVEGGLPAAADRYDLGCYVAEHGRGIRVAVLGNESTVDKRGFGETVAANRGATVGVFAGALEAQAWLSSEDRGSGTAR